MESREYEKILNVLPETGVYVIQEEDSGILYFNKRVREVWPEARLGAACRDWWSEPCHCCPPLAFGDLEEGRSIHYSAPFGGVVDVTTARTLWEGSIPAWILTVTPRADCAGYVYRKILHVDFAQDTCAVLKTVPDGWQPDVGTFSVQLTRFALSGTVHPDDIERFTGFTQLDRLRATAQTGQKSAPLLYRRCLGDIFRWNLMEVVPGLTRGGQVQTALLYIRDVHDVLRESQNQEGLTLRGRDLIRSLGERNFDIYTIDLNSGKADPIRMNGQMQQGLTPAPWDELMHSHFGGQIHEAYQDEFEQRFSLEGLRKAKADGLQKTELLCRMCRGGDCRYISVAAYFSRDLEGMSRAVVAIQDVDERVCQELAHTQRDMQMAAVLKSRYRTMDTVFLDSGQCTRMDLTQPAGPENVLTGDYAFYIEKALSRYVHPDDREGFWAALSLEHLREKAAATEDYAEELCRYRLLEEPVRWIELHIIYSRQKEQVTVNILGRDVTKEKQQEESQRQAMEDRSYIISSLSSLFFCTYYIDVERDTFRSVTQLHRAGDVLGEEVSCTAAQQFYANYFVHPDDRAEYLKTMNVKNLRETLRWWQPYVAVEFRKMPENQQAGPDACGWVRATAVLAKTGEGDMPQTVVYVAQDITGSKRKSGAEPAAALH